jgi:hypothetical protein
VAAMKTYISRYLMSRTAFCTGLKHRSIPEGAIQREIKHNVIYDEVSQFS